MIVVVNCLVILRNMGVKERFPLHNEKNDSDTNETHLVTTSSTVGEEKFPMWSGLVCLSGWIAPTPPGSLAAKCAR